MILLFPNHPQDLLYIKKKGGGDKSEYKAESSPFFKETRDCFFDKQRETQNTLQIEKILILG